VKPFFQDNFLSSKVNTILDFIFWIVKDLLHQIYQLPFVTIIFPIV